jgi:putative phosphotransacetylase
MTDAELDRLADLIARALLSSKAAPPTPWMMAPVRPEPPLRGGDPPVWSGAAQTLGDIAPGGRGDPPRFRETTADLTRVTRAAAAGRGSPRSPIARNAPPKIARPRPQTAGPISVTVGVSNRHLHLSPEHQRALFGAAPLSVARPLAQPGQFAANETVAVIGPKGKLDAVRVVGPARGETQLELARSDASVLGLDPPLAASGSLSGSSGGVTLSGPTGRVELARGVIIAARHLHLSPNDGGRWGLRDGDRLDVRCGSGARAVTFHDVLVRCGEAHATELHLDVDEARAAGVNTGDTVSVLAWRAGSPDRRVLITERDVVRLARDGLRVPDNALLTPSARDRARALGILG